MSNEGSALVVRQETGRLVVTRLAPHHFAILRDETRKIRRRGLDLLHMIQHALDQSQIAHALRPSNLQL